jgi:hypothetical protein
VSAAAEGRRHRQLRTGARPVLALAMVALALSACATREAEVSTPPPTGAQPAAPTAAAPPQWHPGDQWTFRWTVGNQSGMRVAEVVEVRRIEGQPYYLLRIGSVDHLYTRDLHVAGTLRNDAVETRLVPPVPLFTWPLEAGGRWQHRGTYEERGRTSEVTDVFTVVGVEGVDTPAGRFNAIKVMRQGGAGDVDEYWFAPEVRFYVRWIGRRGDAQVEEQLQSYRPVAGEGPPPRQSPPLTPPGTPR